MNLDFSLIDQINRHQSERNDWEELKESYKKAGELEAKIICTVIAATFIIATFCLEVPH